MEEIVFEYINEVYIKITASKSVMKELENEFCYWVPGYRHMPKYKAGIWDGRFRMIRSFDTKLYVGLLPLIEKFCKERKYKIIYRNCDYRKENEIDEKNIEEFCLSQNICVKDKKSGDYVDITPRDYQINSVYQSVKNKRIVLLAATSAGKTLICYLLSKYLLNNSYNRGLIIVPRVDLITQLFNDFKEYSNKNKWDVDENVHKIYSGQDKYKDSSLIVSTYQSLANVQNPEKFFSKFDFVIVDETHQGSNKSISDILKMCVNAKIRVGMTGTLKDNEKVNNLVIQSLLGESYNVITAKESIDRGESTKLEVKCYLLEHENREFGSYEHELKFIEKLEERNEFICNLCGKIDRNILVMFKHVEHGKILYEKIKNKYNDRKVHFYYGDIKQKERERIKSEIELDKNCIVLATDATFSTGLNIKSLNDLILACPYKSNITIQQAAGRLLRINKGKHKVTVHDIGDDFDGNTTYKHFKTRIGIYKKQEFPYKVYKVNINE